MPGWNKALSGTWPFFCTIALLLSALGLPASASTTVVVGTCKTGTKFATIQEAVDAVAPGGKVYVCPGIYPEQVAISRSLTLQGVQDLNSNAGSAVLTAPKTGLIQNGDYLVGVNGIAAQVLIQNTSGPVSINGITVDGSGATCPNPLYWIGIGFGMSVTGSLSNSAVTNVTNATCQYGAAIAAGHGSSVTLTSNSVHGCAMGILANDGASTVRITGNAISNCGARAGAGIAIGSMQGPSLVSSNVVQVSFGSDPTTAPRGIFLGSIHGFSAVVSNNVIVGTRVGMSGGIDVTDSDNPTITGNKISGAYVGIGFQDVIGAVVQKNIISDTDAGISTGRPGDGNTVSGNTINDALCGIYAPTTPGNKFSNIGIINCYAAGIP